MSRYLRPYCPGVAFHVTARVTWKAALFDPDVLRRIPNAIAESSLRCDAQILAYAIMSNHLHLIVRQGENPLSKLLQPALRRVAMLVQRRHKIEGHVFERRYRTHACLDAAYLRDAIVYVHLNPVRAGICSDPSAAEFTSGHVYAGAQARDELAAMIEPPLNLFSSSHESLAQSREHYLAYVKYRMDCDNADAHQLARPDMDPFLKVCAGDAYFTKNYCTSVETREAGRRPRVDLRDMATDMLQRKDPSLTLDALRGSYLRARGLQRIRADIILSASRQGYRTGAIAAFFNMSPARISSIARRPTTNRHVKMEQSEK